MLLSDSVLGSLRWGQKDSNCQFAVEDADWATSDKPVVLGNDGCLRVFDSELRSCHSVLNVLEMGGGWGEEGRSFFISLSLSFSLSDRACLPTSCGSASGQSEGQGNAAAPAVEPGILPRPQRVGALPSPPPPSLSLCCAHNVWCWSLSVLCSRVDDMDSIEKGVKQLLTILPE